MTIPAGRLFNPGKDRSSITGIHLICDWLECMEVCEVAEGYADYVNQSGNAYPGFRT
jgi:hypothetical protein